MPRRKSAARTKTPVRSKSVKKPTKSKSIKKSTKKKAKSKVRDVSDDQLERYRLAFAKLDTNQSNTLDVAEIHAAMRTIGLKCSISNVLDMIAEGDEDDDNELDFDEFVKLMELARTFKTSKAWVSAYDKFVGATSQSNNKGFLFEDEDGSSSSDEDASPSFSGKKKQSQVYNSAALYDAKSIKSLLACGPYTMGFGPFIFGNFIKSSCLCVNFESMFRCIQPKTLCLSTGRSCCIDQRVAIPPTAEIPCEIGMFGVMCIKGRAADTRQCKTAMCCSSCGLFTGGVEGENFCSLKRTQETCCITSSTSADLFSGEKMNSVCDSHVQYCCYDAQFFVPTSNDGTVYRFGACDHVIWETDKPVNILVGAVAMPVIAVALMSRN